MGAETRGSSAELCENQRSWSSHPREEALSQVRWTEFMCRRHSTGHQGTQRGAHPRPRRAGHAQRRSENPEKGSVGGGRRG